MISLAPQRAFHQAENYLALEHDKAGKNIPQPCLSYRDRARSIERIRGPLETIERAW